MDEIGIALNTHDPQVVAKQQQKKIRYRTTGNKNQVTVIACVNARGQCIPPVIILEIENGVEKRRSCWNYMWFEPKGWDDSELFRGWLFEHFLVRAVGTCPLLLRLDDHRSHYLPELIAHARKFSVILFWLPPHTTHKSQPQDASILKSLKQNCTFMSDCTHIPPALFLYAFYYITTF